MARADSSAATDRTDDRNDVELEGTLSADPERRELPSGDALVQLRVVVRRSDGQRLDSIPVAVGPPPAKGQRRRSDQAGRRTVTSAERLRAGDRVRVRGWIERRFWDAGGGRRTRLQVVATEVSRVAPPRGT